MHHLEFTAALPPQHRVRFLEAMDPIILVLTALTMRSSPLLFPLVA
jgi:hypothetical protein